MIEDTKKLMEEYKKLAELYHRVKGIECKDCGNSIWDNSLARREFFEVGARIDEAKKRIKKFKKILEKYMWEKADQSQVNGLINKFNEELKILEGNSPKENVFVMSNDSSPEDIKEVERT